MSSKSLSRGVLVAVLGVPSLALATLYLTSPEIPLNATTVGSQVGARAHSTAAARDGTTLVWQSDDGDGTGIFGRRMESAGLGAEFQVNTVTAGAQGRAAVATADRRGFVVAWSSADIDGDGYGIAARRYDATGAPLGTEFVVNTFTVAGQEAPDVAMAADGSFLVVWESFTQDGDQAGIAARMFDSTGTPLGTDFVLNAYTTGSQLLASAAPLAGGGFAVVWESPQDGDGYGIVGRAVDSLGAPAGSEIVVNAHTTGAQRGAHVGRGAGGDFVVVWSGAAAHDLDGVVARRIGPGPAAVGGDIAVNEFTTGGQSRVAVAGEGDGSFVVVWDSLGQDGDGYGVLARTFDAGGVAAAGEFQVNTFTTGFQGYTNSVSGDGEGNFLLVWADGSQDGDSFGIYGRTLCTDADEDGDCDLHCGGAPATGCRVAGAGKSKISIKDSPDDLRDMLKWKWAKGDATPLEAFLDPVNGTADYAFCIYDESAAIQPLLEALLVPGGLCAGAPCWKPTGTKGFAFGDDAGAQHGIVKIKLKSGDTGKPQVQVLGKGAGLVPPTAPLAGDVIVQFISANPTFDCWQTTYVTSTKNGVGGGGATYTASGP